MSHEKQKNKISDHQKLNGAISMQIEGGSILTDKTKVIGSIYSPELAKQVVHRLNAYDRMHIKLSEILDIITDQSKTDQQAINETIQAIEKLIKES